MKVLKIQSTNRDFANGFKQVFLALEHLQNEPLPIELDFSTSGFINPSLLLPLVALKEASPFSSMLKIDKTSFSGGAASYLSTVHFPDSCNTDSLTEEGLRAFLAGYKRKNYVPIVCFPGGNTTAGSERRDLVISSIGNLIKSSLKLSTQAETAIMMLISELTDNIGDHAGARKGFLVAQNFPGNHYLDICIADCGMGILNSFRRVNPDVVSSGEAIDRAVRGQSTKGIGRGYGISGSIHMLGSIGGEFILLSGNSSFVKRINKLGAIVDIPNNVSWPGCLVLIRVPTTMPGDFSIYKLFITLDEYERPNFSCFSILWKMVTVQKRGSPTIKKGEKF